MAGFSAGSSDLVSAATELLDRVGALVGLAGRSTVESLREDLEQPALIAVAGRVNTGKSTLVNSLVSMKVAPTAAQEMTALPCSYAYGSPARAEAITSSGEAVPVPLGPTGLLPEDLPRGEIRFLRVFLQAAVLRRFTVIDTPGLGSAATGNSVRTEFALLEGTGPWRQPDVLLFLVRDTFRPDDMEFIARYIAHGLESPGRTSPAVIGLLSHADNFRGGPWQTADPVEEARKTAAAMAEKIPHFTSIVPVSGLLAETVRTGALREEDVRTLRRLRGEAAARLQFAEQLGPLQGASKEDLRRLIRIIGAYGLRFGRDHCSSSSELMDWLLERSGLDGVERVLEAAVTGTAARSRAETVLAELAAVARNQSWGREARVLIESARHSPAFHRLQEWAALDGLRAVAPDHGLIALLEDLVLSNRWPDALTPGEDGQEGYLQLAAHYQSLAVAASTGAEAQAARVLARSLLIQSRAAR